MKKIYICSPYRGEEYWNSKCAENYARMAFKEGFYPIVPHLYFTRFLDEDIPEERNWGLEQGLELLKECSEMWVFGKPSEGMKGEIALAEELGIPTVYKDGYRGTLLELAKRNVQLKEDVTVEKEDALIYRHLKELDMSEEEWSAYVGGLSYDELKLIHQAFSKAKMPAELGERIQKAYEAKRLETYPQLAGPVYFPELKEADFLTDEQKKACDNALARYHDGESVHTQSFARFLRKKRFRQEGEEPYAFCERMAPKILAFLVKKGIAASLYLYNCECGSSTYSTKEEYACCISCGEVIPPSSRYLAGCTLRKGPDRTTDDL